METTTRKILENLVARLEAKAHIAGNYNPDKEEAFTDSAILIQKAIDEIEAADKENRK